LNEKRLEKLKNVTVSTSEARRIVVQTEEKSDEDFKKLLERLEEKNQQVSENTVISTGKRIIPKRVTDK
jgi:molybdopterin biosynthesis enzyme MoaB